MPFPSLADLALLPVPRAARLGSVLAVAALVGCHADPPTGTLTDTTDVTTDGTDTTDTDDTTDTGGPGNEAPTAQILAPDGTARLYADVPVAFAALVDDLEDLPSALSVRWTDEGGATVDLDAEPDAGGALAGAHLFAEGAHEVTLTVTDSAGASGSATVAFEVGGANVLPSCAILEPADGAVVAQGADVVLAGSVLDPDVAEDLLSGAWSSDLDGPLGTTTADATGRVELTTAALSPGRHTITLTGTDEVGGTCADTVAVTVGAPPTITLDLPLAGDVYDEGEAVTFLATVADDLTAADALTLTWASDVDGELDTTPADAAGVTTFDADWLTVGPHTVTLTAVDADGLSAQASVAFVINGLPTAPTVAITPANPGTGDPLVATVTADAVDPENDPITYAYAWSVGGVATAWTTPVIPASATTRGEVWRVRVTPSDGRGAGTPGFASVTVGDTPPTLADVAITPDPASEGDTLVCAPGVATDVDGDPVAFTFAWTVNGVPAADTDASLDAAAWTRGDVVVCTVTPTDGALAGAPVASDPVTIVNAVPTVAGVVISPALPATGDTLTCAASGFADADGDADQSTYEWSVNGAVVGTGPTLAGGFGTGDEVRCTVTPSDGIDAGTPAWDSVTIDNTPPVLADATLSPVDPTEADVLVCAPGVTTDVDGTTTFSYTYGWTVNGAPIAATGDTLDGASFDRGDVVQCSVVPNDGTADGAGVGSNAVTVGNSAPVVSSLSVDPAAPLAGDTLTASVTTADLDGDAVTVAYTWSVNGAPAGTGPTFDGFARGDTVVVVAVPNDGLEDGAPVASAPITVGNTAPVLGSVALTPSTADESTTLTCAATATDADGDPIGWAYAWTVNGAPIAASGDTLTGADFDAGDTVVCAATPDDGLVSGAGGVSDPVVIANSAPVATSVALTPATADVSATLTCAPVGTDADGDAIGWTYAWTVDGAPIAATGDTLDNAWFGSGDVVVCEATPNDGQTDGAPMSSNAVTIDDTPPVLSSVVLTPASPTEGSTLTCSPTATDPDGDPITYAYAWLVNGADIGVSTATLDGASFDAGDEVACVVTPSDAGSSGAPMTSNLVTVVNSVPVVTSVTLEPATAYEASMLTCAAVGTDADGDPITWTYAWTVNGAPIGASGDTLTGADFDAGDTVLCAALPDDGTGAGAGAVSDPVVIANTAPVATSVTLGPVGADESSTLTCAAVGADDDGDAVTFAYAWRVNGAPIGATGSTLDGAWFGAGDVVVCEATPNDGQTDGAAVASNPLTIGDSSPVLTAVVLTPASPTEGSTLTCSPTATDPDGDPITYAYAWLVNGADIGVATATLDGASFDAGDEVACEVTPSDASSSGAPMTSNVVTVGNSLPVVTSVALAPATAYEASTLTCAAVGTDADGDPIAWTYAWTVNGTPIGASGDTLTGADFDAGDTVVCAATPDDGTGAGAGAVSNAVVIENTAPVATSVTLGPVGADESSTLTCAAVGADDDGDAVGFAYAWTVNGAPIGATGGTLDGAWFGAGDVVVCAATPNDGQTDGAAVASNPLTIADSSPVLTAVVLTPASPTEGSTLTCSPTATDPDGDPITYAYAWLVNGAPIAATTATLTGASFDAGDQVACEVTPSDPSSSGAPMTSNVVTVRNSLPVVTSVTLAPTTATEASTLTCAATGTDADGDAVTWAYAWTVNGAPIAASGDTLTGADFDAGDTVVCAATPDDGTGAGTGGVSDPVVIRNTAPVATSVTLGPVGADESTTLTCAAVGTDLDGDALFWSYAWTVDGAPVAATGTTLDGAWFDAGDVVLCEATPSDGQADGAAVASNPLTIADASPVLTAVVLTPASPTEGSTLTCSPTATDPDGDPITYAYAWLVNGAPIAATTATLTGASFDAGDEVACEVTPSDASSSGAPMTSNVVTVRNTLPVVTSVSLTPSTATEASTLTCAATGTDADGDAITWAYAWTVNGAPIAASGDTLTGADFDRGDTVVCAATPDDGTGAGAGLSSDPVVIGDTAPVATSVTLGPDPATEGSTLTCAAVGSDLDGDAIGWSYDWTVNGAPIGATTATLTGASFDAGDAVACRATPSDGTLAGSPMGSNVVTIRNSAPVLSAVVLSPATATEATTLTCSPTASDADGDAVTYAYAWTVNGAPIGVTTATLDGASFDAGDAVACSVTPSDGATSGAAMGSNVVTIGNTLPVAETVTLSPTTATEQSTLTCSATGTDADGDALSWQYAWTVNGLPLAASGATLTGADFDRGDTVVCAATPDDGTGLGTGLSSDPVVIGDTAPVAASVTLGPDPAFEGSTLTCAAVGSDVDGDVVSWTYAWTVNGAPIGATTATLTGASFDSGDAVACAATPSDGTLAGAAVGSNVVTVGNSAPVLSSVVLTPAAPTEASTLTCSPTATDADGDAVSYSYAWTVNGAGIAATASTLAGASFDKGDAVACQVTPTDGTTAGAAVGSNVVTIQNTAPGAATVAITPSRPTAGVDDLSCEVVAGATDADGDALTYDVVWTVDGRPYPEDFAGTATGPLTTVWADDTVPAADNVLGSDWECAVVANDGEADGPPALATASIWACGGVPTGPACFGDTVQVAYLPGWSATHTGSASLVWPTLETNSLTYGDCTIDLTSVGSNFSLATLQAYDVIVISDPAGGSRLYTAAEKAAIRDYLEGGHGGAYGSYLMSYLTYDNQDLMDLFGVDPASVGDGTVMASGVATVVDPTHPVVGNVPATFTLSSYAYEQVNTGGWGDDDLLECAEYVVKGAGQSSVIANDGQAWRSVYFTSMPEYNNPGADSQQVMYDALLWAAGYR